MTGDYGWALERGLIPSIQFEHGPLTIQPCGPTKLAIYGDGGNLMVSISMDDGSMEFGKNYHPTAAAQIFWQTVSAEYKEYLEWKRNR